MSGTHERKHKKSRKRLWLILLAAVVLFLAVVTAVVFLTGEEQPGDPVQPDAPVQTGQSILETEEPTVPAETEAEEEYLLSVDSAIKILEIGSYTGPYMEDASDDAVENILQVTLKNMGTEPLQYSKFRLLSDSGEDALFELTTLMPGETMMVLEVNRKTFREDVEYTSVKSENLAYFQYEPSLHEDTLQIQPMDGGFNIRNVSDEDITGKIVIYFKSYSDGRYVGGITYSGTIQHGMKAGEIRQIMSENFTADGTRVVFINIV